MIQITLSEASASGTPVQGLLFQQAYLTFLIPQLVVNGASSVEQVLSLPRNAVVASPFTVTIQAGGAQWTRGKDVARLRQQDVSSEAAVDAGRVQQRTSLVLDFGMLRTVSAVAVKDALTLQVLQVKPWTGMGFADTPIFSTSGTPSRILPSTGKLTGASRAVVTLPSEVRTERLQIDLIGGGTDAVLGESVLVQLPEVPADLELRINGGPPVWTASGPVTLGVGAWTAGEGGLLKQTPDISQALTALLGDPTADKSSLLEMHLVLSARVPGALALDLPPEGARTIRYIRQVTQDFPDGKRELTFREEGLIPVPLQLPDWAKDVEQVTFTLAATLPAERVIPPVGPAPETVTVAGGEKPLAELVLDPDRAACVALTKAYDLVELTGVRLPLRAEPGGAEVSVLLLSPDGQGNPGPPVDGGASRPVTLEAPTGSEESWRTFSFAGPVPLVDARMPFVAVIVGRGRVAWALTKVPSAATDVPGAGEVWCGPPAGPWQRLPAMGVLDRMRGRVRMVGHAGREKAVAPLQIHLKDATGEPEKLTPTPKGIGGTIRPPPPFAVGPNHTVDLQMVSLVAGTVTLRDVLATVTDT